MRNFMEHGVTEKSIKRDMISLIISNQFICNWNQYFLKLGTHCIFQLQSASSFFQLDLLIIWQIDRNGL